MAVVAVAEDSARYDAMDATTNITGIGGGAGAAVETEVAYQNDIIIARKVTAHGFYSSTGANRNMTTTGRRTVLVKLLLTNYLSLSTAANLLEMRLGSGTGAYYEYRYGSPEIDYPAQGGFIFDAIDPNVSAHRYAGTGSPSLTAFSVFGCYAACGTSKEVNLMLDAIDVGVGLYLTGGTSTDPDGTFADFVADDVGAVAAGRFAYVTTRSGAIFVLGALIIGATSASAVETATATAFTDTNETLIFPRHRAAAGFSKLGINLGNASTVATLTAIDIVGRGQSDLLRHFDTEGEVDGTNEEIDITAHGYETGDAVLYSKLGGAEAVGLTDATEYFVEAVTADTISLHTTLNGAVEAGTPVGLTASTAGNGENHSLRRQPDGRPDVDVTGTAGTLVAAGCKWSSTRQVNLASGATLDACVLTAGTLLDVNQGTVIECIISGQVTAPGEAYADTPDLTDISDSEFEAGEAGHAIRRTGTAGTESLSGVQFVGYGNDPSPTSVKVGMQFDTETDVDGTNDEIDYVAHGWATGDAVMYSKYALGTAGTEAIGLTDQALYFVRTVTADSVSLHASRWGATSNSNKIALTASGVGNGEDHSLYSMDAALLNETGGAEVVNVTNAGSTPSVRNIGAAQTTVNNAVDLTIEVVDEAGVAVGTAQVAIFAEPGGTSLMNEDTTAGGIATEAYNFGGAQDIRIEVRKTSTGTSRYLPNSSTGAITANGFSAKVTLIADGIASA